MRTTWFEHESPSRLFRKTPWIRSWLLQVWFPNFFGRTIYKLLFFTRQTRDSIWNKNSKNVLLEKIMLTFCTCCSDIFNRVVPSAKLSRHTGWNPLQQVSYFTCSTAKSRVLGILRSSKDADVLASAQQNPAALNFAYNVVNAGWENKSYDVFQNLNLLYSFRQARGSSTKRALWKPSQN